MGIVLVDIDIDIDTNSSLVLLDTGAPRPPRGFELCSTSVIAGTTFLPHSSDTVLLASEGATTKVITFTWKWR